MRNIRLVVLLTETEKEELQRQADRLGLPLSSFMRAIVMEKMNDTKPN